MSSGLPADPYLHIIDQKGIHYNEAESRNAPSLGFVADPYLPLKTNHSQSRARLTVNTHGCNDPSFDEPVEVLYRLKTDRCLKGLRLPENVRMSFAHAEKGSYKQIQLVEYLRRWLPPWTPEREAARDYRVMFLDDFAVHKTAEVKAVLKERGFFRIMLGGGTTFMMCTLDTDYHAPFSRDYQELENMDYQEQLDERPWRVPTRTRQQIADDVACVWANLPRARIGRASMLRVGFSNALPRVSPNGEVEEHAPEDRLITREAKEFFDKYNLAQLRASRLARVHKDLKENPLASIWDAEKYMLDFSDSEGGGSCEEGKELNDGDDDELPGWEDHADLGLEDGEAKTSAPPPGKPIGEKVAASAAVVASSGLPSVASSDIPTVASSDLPLVASSGAPRAPESEAALLLARRFREYDFLIERLEAMGDKLGAAGLRLRRSQAERATRNLNQDILAELAAEDAKRKIERTKMRAELQAKEANEAKEKELAKKKEEAIKKEKEDAKAYKAKLEALAMELPKAWEPVSFGQGTKQISPLAAKNIREVLDRLRLRAPELPDDLAALWPTIWDAAPTIYWRGSQGAMGSAFIKDINKVLRDLGACVLKPSGTGWKTAAIPDAAGSSKDKAACFCAPFVVRRVR